MSMVSSSASRSLTKNHASMQTRSGLLDKRNTIPQDFTLNQKPPYWNRKRNRNAYFITYFKSIIDIRHRNSSDSIIVNWNRVYALMLIFTDNQPMIFANIDTKLVEDFRLFLLDAPQGGNKKGTISQNTASTYFAIFKAGLKQVVC